LTQLPFEEEIRFPANPETSKLAERLRGHGEISVVEDAHCFRPHSGFPLSAFYGMTEEYALPARLFTSQRPSLEALFLHLTGRTLRE
jgi:ABC-2 type transport system ATP-binding protein